jgi:hypothetical protein
MCVIGGVQTLLTLLCVLQMLLGHYGFFFEVSYKCWCCLGATKKIQNVARCCWCFLCVANVVCGVVMVCKCYQMLFECCSRCFSQVPPLLTPFLPLLMVLPMLFMVFSPIHDMFFYLSFLNKYEFLKVYTSFVDFY